VTDLLEGFHLGSRQPPLGENESPWNPVEALRIRCGQCRRRGQRRWGDEVDQKGKTVASAVFLRSVEARIIGLSLRGDESFYWSTDDSSRFRTTCSSGHRLSIAVAKLWELSDGLSPHADRSVHIGAR